MPECLEDIESSQPPAVDAKRKKKRSAPKFRRSRRDRKEVNREEGLAARCHGSVPSRVLATAASAAAAAAASQIPRHLTSVEPDSLAWRDFNQPEHRRRQTGR